MATKKAADSGRSARSKAANPENTQKKHALTPEMEARKWKPGQSGNPGGRPKRDVASEIACAIFEQDLEKIKKAMRKQLLKGNVKAFAALADRGYGKVPQQVDIGGAVVHVVVDL